MDEYSILFVCDVGLSQHLRLLCRSSLCVPGVDVAILHNFIVRCAHVSECHRSSMPAMSGVRTVKSTPDISDKKP